MMNGTSAVINGKVYFGGGATADHMPEDVLSINWYSQFRNKWTPLSTALRICVTLGHTHEKLVTVGGFDIRDNKTVTTEKDVYTFEEQRQEWKTLIPPMLTARSYPTVLSHPTCLVVAGGRQMPGNVILDTVEIYNINTSQWNRTDKLPIACFNASGVVSKNLVYLVGGMDNGHRHNKTFVASIDELLSNAVPVTQSNGERSAPKCDSAWNEVANTPAYCPSAVAVSDMVLAMGGFRCADLSEYRPVKGIYAYSTSMNSWIQIGVLPAPVACMAIAALSPTEFIVIGGANEDRTISKTVYKGNLNITIA